MNSPKFSRRPAPLLLPAINVALPRIDSKKRSGRKNYFLRINLAPHGLYERRIFIQDAAATRRIRARAVSIICFCLNKVEYMKSSRLLSITATAAAMSGLGCVTMEDVADKTSFAQANFSAKSLNAEVTVTLRRTPPGREASFSRMQFSAIPVNTATGNPGDERLDVTLQNQGHGLFSRVIETVQNGVPISQYYELSYLGFLPLRWNRVPLYEPLVPDTWEIRSFDQFDPFTQDSGTSLQYEYLTSYETGGQKFREHDTCTQQGTHAASELSPALQWQAVYMECDYSNNAATPSRSIWAYLPNYGVALQVSVERADRNVRYSIRKMRIE